MAVQQEFQYSMPDGRPFISLLSWVDTLPIDQQTEFKAADTRQLEFRQQAIDRGDLVLDTSDPSNPNYVWKDEATELRGKPTDPVWFTYWKRYLEETGVEFNIVKSTI